MILHRITSKVHSQDLSGTGAMLYGGRWNGKGVRMLYTSASLSLAALETVVNLSGNRLGQRLFCVELDFPDELPISEIATLPKNWNVYPHTSDTVLLGNNFIKRGELCLKVPSAIIPSEYNYLLNPAHDDFSKVRFLDARPLILDKRLVQNID
ncbi:MAG: RES family NAD+ phosphorylase [Cyclobacteriaceae bacterium]